MLHSFSLWIFLYCKLFSEPCTHIHEPEMSWILRLDEPTEHTWPWNFERHRPARIFEMHTRPRDLEPFITTNMRKINDPETACEPPRASWESLGSFVGASWKFLRASCEPARILQGIACHLLGPPRSLLQPRGSILKNPKTPPGHSYQPLALSWKLPGTQELQTYAPEILFLARKNKDFVFYMKLMYVAAMHKYAPRWGQSTDFGIIMRRATEPCSRKPIFCKEKQWLYNHKHFAWKWSSTKMYAALRPEHDLLTYHARSFGAILRKTYFLHRKTPIL